MIAARRSLALRLWCIHPEPLASEGSKMSRPNGEGHSVLRVEVQQ